MKKLNKIVLHPWLKVDDLARHINKIIDYLESDTVLGEECAVCNPEWEGKQPIPLCEEHDEEILGQPLTEWEYGKPDFVAKDSLGALEKLHRDMSEEEPSKKPSMTIGCNECGNNIRI